MRPRHRFYNNAHCTLHYAKTGNHDFIGPANLPVPKGGNAAITHALEYNRTLIYRDVAESLEFSAYWTKVQWTAIVILAIIIQHIMLESMLHTLIIWTPSFQ
jgi:hypothetical protein